MSPLAQAVRAAEKDYTRLQDWERQELFDEIRRLTDAGMSAKTIAVLVGMSDRQVVRIRNEQVKPPRQSMSYNFDMSDSRERELSETVDAVLELACRIRDEDPALIYDALNRLDPAQCSCKGTVKAKQTFIELLMVALAAMPIDRPKSEIFAWLEEW